MPGHCFTATISAMIFAWATAANAVARRAGRPALSTVASGAFSFQPHPTPARAHRSTKDRFARMRYGGSATCRFKGRATALASAYDGRVGKQSQDVREVTVVADGITMGTRASPDDYYRYDDIESGSEIVGDVGDILGELEADDVAVTSGEQSITPPVTAAANNNRQGNRSNTRKQLKEELRQYRTQQSKPINKPPYTVFTNKALEEICDLLPMNDGELLDVNGIGPKKLEMFGDDILEIVAKYVDGGLERQDSSASNAGASSSQRRRVVTIDPESLTEEQRRAAMIPLEQGTNVFITGAAGTGKSYVLKYLIQEMHNKGIKYGVAAPTGVAAINVGGSTLHSFFGIGLATGSITNLLKKVKKNTEAMKRIDGTDVLCIDECSMLSSDLLETLDVVVRELRHEGKFKDKPFGNMKVIAFGDFFQLPPVYRSEGNDMDREWRPFCFDSPVWSELELDQNTYELKEIQRQEAEGKGSKFVQFLNMVRIGDINEKIIQDFNAKCLISPSHPLPTDGIVPTRLYSLNRNVDEENESRLAMLEGKEVVCHARNEWREKMPTGTLASTKKAMKDSIEKEMPDEVRLKVGAQVMLTRNKDLDRGLVNGSRGVVERFVYDSDGDQIPVVRFDCGAIEQIKKAEAVRYNPEGDQGCLVRKQIPLKLAWAVTVHKSQGTTLTRATLDISSAFEFGQCYVALSRIRSIEGLWLERPARLQNIHVSPQVLEYYDNI